MNAILVKATLHRISRPSPLLNSLISSAGTEPIMGLKIIIKKNGVNNNNHNHAPPFSTAQYTIS